MLELPRPVGAQAGGQLGLGHHSVPCHCCCRPGGCFSAPAPGAPHSAGRECGWWVCEKEQAAGDCLLRNCLVRLCRPRKGHD